MQQQTSNQCLIDHFSRPKYFPEQFEWYFSFNGQTVIHKNTVEVYIIFARLTVCELSFRCIKNSCILHYYKARC